MTFNETICVPDVCVCLNSICRVRRGTSRAVPADRTAERHNPENLIKNIFINHNLPLPQILLRQLFYISTTEFVYKKCS